MNQNQMHIFIISIINNHVMSITSMYHRYDLLLNITLTHFIFAKLLKHVFTLTCFLDFTFPFTKIRFCFDLCFKCFEGSRKHSQLKLRYNFILYPEYYSSTFSSPVASVTKVSSRYSHRMTNTNQIQPTDGHRCRKVAFHKISSEAMESE